MSSPNVKGTHTRKAKRARDVPAASEPLIPTTGNVTLDAMSSVVNTTAAPFQNAPPPEQGALGAVNHYVGGAMAVVGAPFELMDAGFAALTAGLASVMPGLPAAVMGAPHLGMPHAHSHPPSLVPPAPPVPLPSIGMATAAGCVTVLIGGMPSIRASDIGPAPTCVSFSPMFEVYTGSSNTFIGGSRASRMSDITRHCNPASAAGAFGAAMGAVGVALGASTAIATATSDSGDGGGDPAAAAAAAAGAAASAAAAAAQAAADAVALAMSALLGKDPGIAPAMGTLMVGYPTVLIGGFPMPDLLDLLGGLVKAAKKAKKALKKKLGKKSKSVKKQKCTSPGEPIDITTGESFNEHFDALLNVKNHWKWLRYYKTGWCDENRSIGRGFRHNYDRRLLFRRKTAGYLEYDGAEISFDRNAETGVYSGSAFGYRLEPQDDALYLLHLPDGEETLVFQRLNAADEEAQLLKIIRKSQPVLHFTYDISSNLSTLWWRQGERVEKIVLKYDEANNLTQVEKIDLNGSPTHLASYEYDSAGHLITATDALGATHRYSYHQSRMTRSEDGRGYGLNWEYDHLGRCIETSGDDGLWACKLQYEVGMTIVEEGDGGKWIYKYNDDEVVTTIIDPYGGRRQYFTDDQGLIVSQRDPQGRNMRWLYDANYHHYAREDCWGNVVGTENREPNPASGRELRTPSNPREAQLGKQRQQEQTSSYSILNPQAVHLPHFIEKLRQAPNLENHQDLTEYDGKGNIVFQQNTLGQTKSTQFSPYNKPTHEIDRDGSETTKEYGSWMLLMKQTDATASITEFRYDHRQNIIAIKDPRGHVVQYKRDLCGRVEAIYNEGELEECYQYDPAGNLIASRDGNNALMVSYEYGERGLFVKRTQRSGEEHTYDYDMQGNFTKASTKEVDVTLAYDWQRRILRDKRNNKGIENFVDANGNKISRLLERFEIQYRQEGAYTYVTLPTGERQKLLLMPDGSIARTHSNHINELSEYNEEGRCVGKYLWREKHSAPLWYAQYTYSGEGELKRINDTFTGNTFFTYDKAHRVTVINREKGNNTEYRYDEAGNLLKNARYHWLRCDIRNQLIEAPLDRFVYNRRYHLEQHHQDELCTTYHYNSLDRLVKITWSDDRPDWIAEYDGLGRRLYKAQGSERTDYYWEGKRIVAEQKSTGELRLYVYPTSDALLPIQFIDYDSVEAEPESGRSYSVHYDQVGLPKLIYDAKGEVVWYSPSSDAYGLIEEDARNRVGYALRFPGHYYDSETGLHYNRFRYYDPALGRYLQSDPKGQAGGINIYAYSENPLVCVDVFGLDHDLDSDKVSTKKKDADYAGATNKEAGDDANLDVTKKGWNGPCDYSCIADPKNLTNTKPTPRQVREMKRLNREHNDGVLRSDMDGSVLVDSQKSTRGVTPPSNEAQIDHIIPVDKGGTRTSTNLQILSRKQNRDKWNN